MITSRDPSLSPLSDSELHYQNLFHQPNPEFHPMRIDPNWLGVGDENIADLFTIKRVKKAILKYPNSKSCGSDSIHIRILKAIVDTSFLPLLTKFFKLCARIGLTPQRWNTSTIVPIPKKENETTINAMRPITLTQMIRRIFEIVVLPHMVGTIEFHPSQAGFRRGYSTVTQALSSHERCLRNDTCSVFLDFACAYDSVPIPLLLKKLVNKGASPGLVSLIASLFLKCHSRVVVNYEISKAAFVRERGIFQGSVLAPILFNVFIDDLASELEETAIKNTPKQMFNATKFYSPQLLFADDLLMQNEKKRIVQMMLTTAQDWSERNGMIFNISKCGSFQPGLFLGDKEIPQVDQYRYLGFPHEPKGINWQQHLDKNVDKASKLLDWIQAKSFSGMWPEWIRVAIFKSFVRPTYEYGAPALYHLFNTKCISLIKAEKFQTRAIRWTVGLSKKKDKLAIALADLPKVEDRFYILAISFMNHIEQSAMSNPIQKIRRAFFNPPWPPNSILPRVLNEKILFQHLPNLERNEEEPLHLFVLRRIREFVDRKYSSSGILPSLILRSCRRANSDFNKTYGMDRCLYIRDYDIRRSAILWRANVYGMRRRCPVCKQQFTRAHVDRCNLLAGLRLGNTQLLVEQDRMDYPHLENTSYGTIDHLLNNKKYYLVELAFRKLELLWEEDNSNSNRRRN